ncbi:MAG: hypothetical protein AB8G11_06185 [Saprospiraceae bacterium]
MLTIQQYKLYFIITILLIGFPILLSAQYSYEEQPIEEKPFSETKWEKLKRNIDYSSEFKEEKEETREDETVGEGRRGEEQEQNQPNWANRTMFQGNDALKYIFFGIAIVALVFVLWRIVQAQMKLKNPKIKKQIADLEQAVDKIEESDLDRLLRESLKSDNYKMAIRVYYLMIIKGLSDKELINWKKDKTNTTYIREMRKTDYYDKFKQITREFEKAWFGEKGVSQEDFQRLQPEFQRFVNVIK